MSERDQCCLVCLGGGPANCVRACEVVTLMRLRVVFVFLYRMYFGRRCECFSAECLNQMFILKFFFSLSLEVRVKFILILH